MANLSDSSEMTHKDRMILLINQAVELYPKITGVHPAADLFPYMEEDEFGALVKDVAENGFLHPVRITDEGLVIDGRNRLCASIVCEKDARLEYHNPTDPIQYVVSENLARRHLTSQQRAVVAVKAEDLYEVLASEAKEKQGERTDLVQDNSNIPQKFGECLEQTNQREREPRSERTTQRKIAKTYNTNGEYVRKVKKVKDYAPELLHEVESGKTNLNKAAKVAKQREKEAKQLAQETQDSTAIDYQEHIVESSHESVEPQEDSDPGTIVFDDIEKIVNETEEERRLREQRERREKIKKEVEEKRGIYTEIVGGYELHTWYKKSKSPFNTANESIDWAWSTWNPVTGCLHTCNYCYARDIATSERTQKAYPKGFAPVFHPYRLNTPAFARHFSPTKIEQEARKRNLPLEQANIWAKNVFVCSMADLFGKWVPDEWILHVFDSVQEYDSWNYLFLTKYPQRIEYIGELLGGSFPANCWVGTTVDEQKRVPIAEKAFQNINASVKWLSVEPLLTNLEFNDLSGFDMVAIGGLSANSQVPASQPKWEWVENIIFQARKSGTSVYFKENLRVRPKEMPSQIMI